MSYLDGKSELWTLLLLKHRWDIKLFILKNCKEGFGWGNVAHKMGLWWTVVNTVMSIWIVSIAAEFKLDKNMLASPELIQVD